MAAPKGNKFAGSRKGIPNKTTTEIREAYQLLIESNLDNLTTWLKRIAAKDPERAIRILADLSEFVLPKLARTEIKMEGELTVEQKPFIVAPPASDGAV
jgi:hypothetical protein